MRTEELEKWLAARIAKEIGLGASSIDAKAPLLNYLMNGFQSWRIVPELEKQVGRSLPGSILYHRPTISELAKYLNPQNAERRQPARVSVFAEA